MIAFVTISRLSLVLLDLFLYRVLLACFLLGLIVPAAHAQFVLSVGSTSTDIFGPVGVDAAGNTYVAGSFSGTVDFDPGAGTAERTASRFGAAFVASYDAAGAFRFVVTFDETDPLEIDALAVSAAGDVALTGEFEGTVDLDPGAGTSEVTSNGFADVFVLCLDTNGGFRFGLSVGGSQGDGGKAIALDGSSNVYVTGRFFSTGTAVDFDPGPGTANETGNGFGTFVASYDAAGAFRYALSFDESALREGSGEGIGVDAAGNAYVAGYFEDTVDFDPGAGTEERTAAGGFDAYLASFSSTGALRFVVAFGGSDDEFPDGLGLDATGNIYVGGRFRGTVDFDPGAGMTTRTSAGSSDAFVSGFDATGAFRFVTSFGAASLERVFALTADPAGNTYIGGDFSSTVDFDPGAGVEERTPSPAGSAYVASYDTNGAFRYAAVFTGGNSSARGVTVDVAGGVRVGGRFQGTVDFDPGPGVEERMSNGSDDGFLVGLLPSGALPVELVSFTATRDGEQVALFWQTASETNNAGFEVERKQPGTEAWTQLGFVEGRGTTLEAQRYRFTDAALPFEATTLVYRLKQIDFDGAFDYSPEVEVALEAPRSFALEAAYPNPFNPTTTIRYALPAESEVKLAVYDVLGREVAVLLDARQAAGRHAVVWEAGSLPSGMYFYRLAAGQFSQARRVMLLK